MNEKYVKPHALGSFKSISDQQNSDCRYALGNLNPGINFQEEHIIKLTDDKQVEWVISRICDHASGKLEPCANKQFAQCPLHGWKLDLDTLDYCNVNVTKKRNDFSITENEIIVHQSKIHLRIPKEVFSHQKTDDLHIRFLAHASLLFTCGNINIVTDPWLKGPCFLNGWWHSPAPSVDSFDQLLNADLVYISHNHPDHMHEETLLKLQKIRPDIPIVVPNYKTRSTEAPLKNFGFTNVIPLAFNQIYKLGDHDIFISILKSGDFRDDSGLYLCYGKKQALITVDSSALNHYVLPVDIDLLATSFASGASGHPWCFDHYSEQEKLQITHMRHRSVKESIIKYITSSNPRAYMPYAGYFSEAAVRDEYIKHNNQKNSPETIEKLVKKEHPNTIVINPIATDQIAISQAIKTCSSQIEREVISSDDINHYLDSETLPDEQKFLTRLKEYFLNCQFKDDLILYLLPCDSDFKPLNMGLIINFSDSLQIELAAHHEVTHQYQQNSTPLRQLHIKVRAASLWQVVKNLKSWEELSIGFHCRIHRKPDVYNSDFWYHFSNVYIK